MNSLAADLDHVLTHVDWEPLRGGRLFLTGGTGFFGCWLLESLAWANDRLGLKCSVVALTRDPAAFARKCQHLVRRSDVELKRMDVSRGTIEAQGTTHAIWAAPVVPAFYFSERPRVLFTSSGAVYGKHCPGAHESDQFHPGSDYAWKKIVGEGMIGVYQSYNLPVVIVRPFAFVGPYLPPEPFAVGTFLRDGLAGKPIRVTNGRAVRSYLYAADLAVWLWTALLKGEPGRPYNVGSEDAITIADLAAKVAGLFGVPVQEETPADAPEDRYVPCTKRAREELGLVQRIGLDDALERTIRWHMGRA